MSVIVFGPTGHVGAVTALTAHQHGAKVILAMRDTQRSIPGLTPGAEKGSFQRVHANLTQPETIREAVTSTGAKHAFIYAVFDTPDSMRSSIEALKAAGIETVVMLSSLSVQSDIRAVPASDSIAFAHAQVEISLDEVFGAGAYVAVRPAFFASNAFLWKDAVRDGVVKMGYPGARFDYIAPEDIGRVCGTFLARGLPEKTFVELMGPERMTMNEAVEVIGRAIGREVEVVRADEEEALRIMVTVHGLPEPVARHLLVHYRVQEESGQLFLRDGCEEAVGNVQRYTGKPSLRFHEWVDLNRGEFLVDL